MYYLKDESNPTVPGGTLNNLVGAIALAVELRMHCGGHYRVVDYWGREYWNTGRNQPQVSLVELY